MMRMTKCKMFYIYQVSSYHFRAQGRIIVVGHRMAALLTISIHQVPKELHPPTIEEDLHPPITKGELLPLDNLLHTVSRTISVEVMGTRQTIEGGSMGHPEDHQTTGKATKGVEGSIAGDIPVAHLVTVVDEMVTADEMTVGKIIDRLVEFCYFRFLAKL